MAYRSKVTTLVLAGKGPGALGAATGAAQNAVAPVNPGPVIARVVASLAACDEIGAKLPARISRRFGFWLVPFVFSGRHRAIEVDTGRILKLAGKFPRRRECDWGAGPA